MEKLNNKVLICTQMFPVSNDGAIISGMIKNPFYQTLTVAKHLEKVDVITTGDKVFTSSISGIDVYSVGNGWLKGVFKAFIYETKIAMKALSLCKKNKYDLIHIHHLNIPILILFKKLGFIKAKIVYTAHGTSTPELNAARQGSRLNHFLLQANGYVQHFLDMTCWKSADLILVPSKFQVKEMKELYSVNQVSLEVVYNGYDENIYKPSSLAEKESFKKSLGLLDSDKTVLYVGRAAKKKGIEFLIKVMDKVVQKLPNTKLILVVGYMGRQKVYRDTIKEMAQSRSYIKYCESVPEKDMGNFYGMADVSVFPSVGYESIPTVIYEAMASGSPVITQGSWGVPEVLDEVHLDEQKIINSDFDLEIIEVLTDDARRNKMIDNNLKKIERFSWANGGKLLADIYKRVINNE